MKIDEAVAILESKLRSYEALVEKVENVVYQPGYEVDTAPYHLLMDALAVALAVLADAPRVAPARRGDPSTSQEAADLVRPKKAHEALLRVMQAGGEGEVWTGKRMADAAGITGQASWWKRVSEIKQAGYIAATGTEHSPETGRKVETYRLTEKGMRA